LGGFLWFGLKTIDDGFLQLSLKTVVTVFSNLTSKLVAMVSPGLALKPMVGFLVEPQNQGGGGFFGLGVKTDSYRLLIWVSKSPRWFHDLGLKTKHATFCRLRHKTDGRATAWDTHRDLAACFMCKQIRLGFSSLASRLTEVRRRVVHMTPSWRLCQSQVEDG
jgi:hypothetical protein